VPTNQNWIDLLTRFWLDHRDNVLFTCNPACNSEHACRPHARVRLEVLFDRNWIDVLTATDDELSKSTE
jgi:hypothetical protein